MPSRILGSQHPQSSESLPQPQPRPKKGLKSVLGFSRASSPEPRPSPAPTITTTASASAVSVTDPPSSFSPVRPRTLRERRSVDVVSGSGSFTASLSYRRKNARTREGRASVTDVSFFSTAGGTSTPSTAEPDAITITAASASTSVQQQHTSALSVPTTPTRPVHAVNLNSPEAKPRLNNMATANAMPRIVNDIPQERTSRQKLARIKAQDGPWSVSVAESPYDKNSYSLYIKTPTHHMTLTRTGQEIQELHKKLQNAQPDAKLPEIPTLALDDGEQLTDKKRKSSFLHTLSRLASPGPNRRERPRDTKVPNPPSSRNSVVSSVASPVHTTPVTPAAKESDNWDPFMNSLSSPLEGGSATSTALASYLTTIANEQALKHTKPWRRFVRIRTDDLISERVERAVKRVRSDLAAHLTGSKQYSRKVDVPDDASLNDSVVLLEAEDGGASSAPGQPEERNAGIIENIKEEEEEEDARTAENGDGAKNQVPVQEQQERQSHDELDSAMQDQPGTPRPSDTTTRGSLDIPEPMPTPTETNASIASRIPRSQSADPDKASRMSRVFRDAEESAAESAAEYESETQAETEVEEGKSTTTVDDDSSVSTSDVKRKSKRKFAEKSVKKPKASKKVVIDDFEMMRVLGKGCAGKVLLVRHKKSDSLYALKAIMKRHVLAHQELQHTLTEQAVLKRMAREAKDPFVVKLWWSFHDKDNLYLVMDFHPGGDLATQLARWGRLGRDRARFYAAEIVEGVEGLHAVGVIYRDLKPENILIGADGHIVLTDFGLSKEFPRRTAPITAPATPSGSRTDLQPMPYWMKGDDASTSGSSKAPNATWAIGQNELTTTFCGTAEYLAPEVIQGQQYSYEVDWWSFGTMLYEMLTGITPFWANNHSDMYARVLQDELRFPDDRVMDQDTKSLIRGLLQRDPALRIKQPRIRRHPYFSMIDWSHVYYKRYIPPYIPPIDPSNASDTQNFDDTFLDMEPVVTDEREREQASADERERDAERVEGQDTAESSTAVPSLDLSVQPKNEDDPDVFDGYSFKGRHSVIIDDEDEEGEVEEEEESIDEEGDMERLANIDLGGSIEEDLLTPSAATTVMATTEEEDVDEPKTPEAKKPELPEAAELHLTAAEEIAALHRAATAAIENLDEERAAQEAKAKAEKEALLKAVQTPLPDLTPPKQTTSRLVVPPRTKPRKEKSGIAALDKYLSDGGDEDDGNATERDDDDDWDFIEAPGVGIEDRNGGRGTTLFARGVVDRYRLAVFRKSSTPGRNAQKRNVSGMSLVSSEALVGGGSPSPSEKQRRGRNSGLPFRRNPRQFLRAKSPEPSMPSTNGITKSLFQSSKSNGALSTTNTNGTGEPSTAPNSTQVSFTAGPSLKSKESSTSMGSPSSDDQSINGDASNLNVSGEMPSVNASEPSSSSATTAAPDTRRGAVAGEESEKPKSKKLKKYKENAEKMLSIFASPR